MASELTDATFRWLKWADESGTKFEPILCRPQTAHENVFLSPDQGDDIVTLNPSAFVHLHVRHGPVVFVMTTFRAIMTQ